MNNTITFEQKKSVVEAWRASGRTQQEFCQNHPARLAPRTLRAWAREVRVPEEGLERALARVAESVQEVSVIMRAIQNARGHLSEPAIAPTATTVPAAARGRPASPPAGEPEAQEPAAGGCRLADPTQAVGAPQPTFLDDLRAQVQAALMSGADGDERQDAIEEQVAVRPVPVPDPWGRGGGFVAPF